MDLPLVRHSQSDHHPAVLRTARHDRHHPHGDHQGRLLVPAEHVRRELPAHRTDRHCDQTQG